MLGWLDQDAERHYRPFCFWSDGVVCVFFVDELNSRPEQFSKSELTVCVLLARVPEMSSRCILTTRVGVVLRGHAGDSLQQTHTGIYSAPYLFKFCVAQKPAPAARARSSLYRTHTCLACLLRNYLPMIAVTSRPRSFVPGGNVVYALNLSFRDCHFYDFLGPVGPRRRKARETREGAQGPGRLGRGGCRGRGGVRVAVRRGGRGTNDSGGHRLLPVPGADFRHP